MLPATSATALFDDRRTSLSTDLGFVVVQVIRHASDLGSWEQASVPAPRGLEGFVERITGYSERTPRPTRRLEAPGNQVTLILGLGPAIGVEYPAAGRPAVSMCSFVSGLHASHAVVSSSGHQAGVQVVLTPFGARALVKGLSLHELVHAELELADVLGPGAGLLAERAYEAATWDERIALVGEAIRRRIAAGPGPTPSVAFAFTRLRATHGAVSVDALARELGCSRRHLAARFREEVGLPPKTVARIERFRHARALLESGHDLATVAHGAGYADQPHFNRDFRAFAGVSPMAFLARRVPDNGGIDAGGSHSSKTRGRAKAKLAA